LERHPHLLDQLDAEDFALLAKYCWETNKSIDAVRLMLDLGFPVESREHNHGCTPLHNAAWCGDLELVRLLLDRGHPVNVVDPSYGATPIGWAVHSCVEARRHPEGQFTAVVELLLTRGADFDPNRFPVGDERIDAVLRKHVASDEPKHG
jgi:ankyrin repeat protein